MRFRLGMATGFAAGYYMGTKAGRQRYDEINRSLAKLRRSDTIESAAGRAKAVIEDGVDKARSIIDQRTGNGHGNGPGSGLPGQPGYSSSR